MHVWQGRQTFVFFFSENVCYSNQTFLCLDFSQFSLFAFYNCRFTNVTNTIFISKYCQPSSPQSRLYFQDFQGSKLLSDC